MSSITIVWKPIYFPDYAEGGYFFSGYHHAFLVYDHVVDGIAITEYARGGPASNNGVFNQGSGFLGTGTHSGPGMGPIVVKDGIYAPGTPDWPKSYEPSFDSWPKQNVILGDDLDLSGTWSTILDSLHLVGAAKIPYDVITPFNYQKNSNSVISP